MTHLLKLIIPVQISVFFEINDRNVRILHQNIAGALCKKNILELTIANLTHSGHEPDIICLSETFLRSGCEQNFRLTNYEMASFYSRGKKRGGVCILLKYGLRFKHIEKINNLAITDAFECCGIEIMNYNLIVVCLYRTPTSNIDYFFKMLQIILHSLSSRKNKKIVIVGDLNINTLVLNKNSTTLTDLTKNYNLKLHITTPTRINSCIDHIISNIDEAVGTVLPLGLSDHETAQMLTFQVERKQTQQNSWSFTKKEYSDENIQKFKNCLKSLSFSEVYMEVDPNIAFQTFCEIFKLFYDLCFPEKCLKVNRESKAKWISKGLKLCCRKKRNLRFKYYKNKTEINKTEYELYSRLLKKCIIASQKIRNNKRMTNSRNSCRAAWSIIKDNGPRPPTCISEIKCVTSEKTLTDPTTIARAFNEYLLDLTNKRTMIKPECTFIDNCQNTIFLRPVSVTEVKNIITSLNNTNAEGFDEVSTKVVKACKDELSDILAYLINLSLEYGVFPELLKKSIVKPLHKKGDSSVLGNYRPIALISVFSKLYEKAVHKRLNDFFVKNRIIKEQQYGFQKAKSTTLATFSLVHNVLLNIDKKYLTTVLYFDMTKAFDFVAHDILLHKLERNGIRGRALDWIKSYLFNRKQCVEVNKINTQNVVTKYKSEYKVNRYGVPQGSILGPLLFLIYINDITEITPHQTILYADDISIIVRTQINKTQIHSINNHLIDIHNTINLIVTWLNSNNLKVNLTKTKLMNFNQIDDININFGNIIIDNLKSVKFLGITMDRNLNWRNHIEELCKKLNKFVYALGQLRKTASQHTALLAYHGYVGSVLRYGIILWGHSSDSNRIFVTQKKCIRAICMVHPLQSCKPLFKKLNILPLPSLYIYEMSCFVKQHMNLFKKASEIYPRNTRNPDRLVLTNAPRTRLYQKNCYAMGIKIYNKLPADIKLLPLIKFKRVLHAWLLQNNFYTVSEFFDFKVS